MIALPIRQPIGQRRERINAGRRSFLKRAAIAAPALLLPATGIVKPSLAQVLQFSGAPPINAWENVDGSLGAPTGTPNLPNLLNSYSFKPPWRVAGVNYRVGINTGVSLKNPASDTLPSGCTRNVGNQTFQMNSTTTVDGWDFSGWELQWFGGNNSVVRNCRFDHGFLTVIHPVNGGTAVGGVVEYCEFDQQGQADATCLFQNFREGDPWIYQYNWFRDSYHMHFQATGGNTPSTWIVRWNLLENCGLGSPSGAHGDFWQLFGGNPHTSVDIIFNTVVQTTPTAATQGWSLNASTPLITNAAISNNTHVITEEVNYVIIMAKQWLVDTCNINQNYCDMTGVSGDFLQENAAFPGPENGTFVVTNNVNMITGAPIT